MHQHLVHYRGALYYAAVGRQVALEHSQAACLAVGIVDGADNLRIFVHCACDILSQRLSCDGQTVGVEKVLLVQLSHDSVHAARLVEILYVGGACRRQVAQVRSALADAVGEINLKVHADLVGNGRKMQHAVGGASQSHVNSQGI